MTFLSPSLPSEVEFGDGLADVGAEHGHLPQQLVHRIQSFLHHRGFVVGEKMSRVEGENLPGPIQLTLGKTNDSR